VTVQLMTPERESVLTLSPELDRLAAEPLCRVLQDRLTAGERLLIDGSLVERVATASLQVLLAAARSAAARDVEFRLSAATDALIEALDDLGLTGLLPGVERDSG
jgi:anti-anti-sigma regulatory factor